jgi:hypothetical protein
MRTIARHVCAFAAFAALATLLSWPLPRHLSTHLTASPSGDAGVYVWNLWVFRHELVEHGQLPLYTSRVFPLTGRADLSLHNYTVATNVLALPVLPRLGLIRTFNLLYLLQLAASGYGVFLLAHFVTTRRLESFLAGAVFMASPVLTARSLGHFSLVAAAPIALFLLAALRYRQQPRTRYAVAAGAAAGWAGYSDAYFAIYCVMLAAVVFANHIVRWPREADVLGTARRRLVHVTDGLVLVLGALAATLVLARSEEINIAGVHIGTRTLYTPMLMLAAAVSARVALASGRRLRLPPANEIRRGIRFMAVTAIVGAIVLSPLLVAAAMRAQEGTFASPRTFWRSSPSGVDALSLVMPNPTSPWFGGPFREWLLNSRPDGLVEYTGAFSLVALCVILVSWQRRRTAIPKAWIGGVVLFSLLALGPFVHVAGVNTFVPGPWAFVRYIPIIGLARTPSRFAIVASMGLSVLFAFGLAALRDMAPARRRLLTVGVGAALALELVVIPRPLFSAAVPAIYKVIAADPDQSVRVLELPFGLRDGTTAAGDFSAATQFYQAFHGKSVLGGYLSRISPGRIARTRRMPVLKALLALSENAAPEDKVMTAAYEARSGFCQWARVGYVVIDTRRASERLRRVASDLLDLEFVSASDGLELYRPRRIVARPPVSITTIRP